MRWWLLRLLLLLLLFSVGVVDVVVDGLGLGVVNAVVVGGGGGVAVVDDGVVKIAVTEAVLRGTHTAVLFRLPLKLP